jgi:hypothetical protein
MATGTRYSYTDGSVNMRSIADAVYMIDWTEAPLLNILGFGPENVRKFDLVNFPSTKVEWIEDTMSPYTTTIAEALDNSETGVDVATDTGAYFRQGDIVAVDSEYMLVTSVSTDTLTVTRGYGSTTAASHNDASTITLLTRAMPEGSDATTGHTTTTSQPYNYSQIISEAAKATKTALAIKKYGITDEMDYQVSKLFANGGQAGKLAQFLQRTFYYGKRVQRSASAYGSMGGFGAFVTTNVTNLSSASLQRSDIHTKIRQIRDAGGMCTHLITGSWGLEKINGMYEGAIRTTRDETRGGSEITMVKTPHGEVEVVYDWMCPAGYMYFVNQEKCGWLPVRAFEAGKIAEQGDYFLTDVVGEYTFAIANEESHGLIYGFSTSS